MTHLPILKPIRTCVLTPNYTAELADLHRIDRHILYRHWINGELVLTGVPWVDCRAVESFFGLRLSAQFGVN